MFVVLPTILGVGICWLLCVLDSRKRKRQVYRILELQKEHERYIRSTTDLD